jgi:hypothetical protein
LTCDHFMLCIFPAEPRRVRMGAAGNMNQAGFATVKLRPGPQRLQDQLGE